MKKQALVIILGLLLVEACERAPKPSAPSIYEIQLQSRTFTPKAGIPTDLSVRIARMIAKTDSITGLQKQRAHILLQLYNPPESADLTRFADQGLTLLKPFNKRTWYAAVTSSGAQLLSGMPGVRWAELMRSQDKLAKGVQKDAPVLPYHMRPEGRIAYSVLFHKDVTAEEVQALTDHMDIRLEDFDEKAFPVVRAVTVNIPSGQLEALAEVDIISWIEPGPAPVEDLNVLTAQPLSNVDVVQLGPFDLDGTGITVGVWEAGDVIYAAHLDLTPRVIVQAGQTASIDDHAAHVAGTIGASGVNVPNAEGMAPNVTIASWDQGGDAAEMTNAANSAGNPGQPTPIQISNHSYGWTIGYSNLGTVFNPNQNLFGLYNNLSVNFDNVVFQTGLIVVKAAGNDRSDVWNGVTLLPGPPPVPPAPAPPGDCFQGGLGVAADCIGPMGVAKNVITVGAMNGAGAITAFSSYGPTDDGRIKPDLMAEGFNMLSLASNNNTASTSMGGTSMATPVVSGIAALVLQESNTRNVTMTPAAMKALLIQTAQDVQGIGQSRLGPDYATGWGIVDAEAAVNLLRQSGLVQGTLIATGIGNAWNRTFYVPAGQAEIHLTLAWDDPAGNPGGQILINDLDLRLIAPDLTQFTPWTLNAANPAQAAVRNGGNDAVNNVEQVSVLNPMTGVWTVRVSANAFNLPQTPQAFAVAGVLPRSDIVLVMDRSGSMSLPSGTPGITKLQALQSGANEFIDLLDLGGGHRLGLVQFEENLVPYAPPFDLQQLAAGNIGDAHTAINSMFTGGWTNIIAGIGEADNQLGSVAPPYPRQSIVVFSDGKHNRPFGSDLNDIDATVQVGNYSFYSIGYGTDVNDAILSNVANNSGGIHVNEQDLLPIQLTKYFLMVGALVQNMAVLSDPRFELGEGESAELPVNISKLDQSITFAVNWTGKFSKDIKLMIEAPDERCSIPLQDHEGLQIRNGETYHLIRVELPYDCNGLIMHDGTWSIHAKPDSVLGGGKETVDIMILGDSRLKLEAKSTLGENEQQLIFTAWFLQDGFTLSIDQPGDSVMVAHIFISREETGDSGLQDSLGIGSRPDSLEKVGEERHPITLWLSDKGRSGDEKAGDGIFSAAFDVSALNPGLVQVRLVAKLQDGGLELTREATTSFYVRP